jgi:hypothetical protein
VAESQRSSWQAVKELATVVVLGIGKELAE